MVLVKWLIIKSGAIQKRGLFITLVFIGFLFLKEVSDVKLT